MGIGENGTPSTSYITTSNTSSTSDSSSDPKEVHDCGWTRLSLYKYGQTIVLVLLWVTMGIYSSLITICLPDLRDRLGTTTQAISVAVGAKQVGSLVGSLGGGIAHDRFHTHSNAFLAVALLLAGTSVLVQPWSAYVQVLGTAIFIEGLAQGTIDAVGNSFVTSIWGVHVDPPLHAIHFGFTVGAMFTPFMASPYLSPRETEQDSNGTSTFVPQPGLSRIEIPYSIAGALTVAMSVVLCGFWLRGPPASFVNDIKPKSSLKQVFQPASCADGKTWFGLLMVTLLILWAVFSQGVYGTFSFYYTFATESSIGITQDEGAWFDFTMKTSGMVGRLLGSIISHFCPIQVMLMVEVVVIVASLAGTAAVGVSNKIIFWVLGGLTQMMANAAWPALYAFTDKYITLFSFIVALTMAGSGLSGFFVSWAVGYLFDNVSEVSIFYLSTAASVAWLLVHIIMQVVASYNGVRSRGPLSHTAMHPGHVENGIVNYDIDEEIEMTQTKL